MDRRVFMTATASAAFLTAAASAQISQFNPLSTASGIPHDALAAAKAWLDLVDADKPDVARSQASAFFQASITPPEWNERVAGLRATVGHVIARSLVSGDRATKLPGSPDGDYLILHFSSAGYRRSFDEIVTMQTQDDHWQVAGFFARSGRLLHFPGVGALPMRWK